MPPQNHILTVDLNRLLFWRTDHAVPGSELGQLLTATQRIIHILHGWVIQPMTGLTVLPLKERQALTLSLIGQSMQSGQIQLALPATTNLSGQLVQYFSEVLTMYSAEDLPAKVRSSEVALVSRLSSVHSEILDFLRLCDPVQAGQDGVMQIYWSGSSQPFLFGPENLTRIKQLQGIRFLGQLIEVEIQADKIRFSNGRVDFKIRPGVIWNVRLPADYLVSLRVQVHKTPRAKLLMRGRPEMQFGQKNRRVNLFVLESFDLLF